MDFFRSLGSVEFPAPSEININMMPFLMGDPDSIPSEYRQYLPLIEACDLPNFEKGKVGYLTISESFVQAGKSQRRGGIHVEKHPSRSWGGGWGGRRGGLYMSSNVPNSCSVWDSYVEDPGPMGDCEHLRSSFPEGRVLRPGELVWMTDGTPHEALPQIASAYRQFFRLVTSEVSVWYRDHSTPNRLGILPPCQILEGNKFA